MLTFKDQFWNLAHRDRDVTKYTHGIGANCTIKGKLASFADGFWSEGGFFFVADYGIIIDYSAIDGVVEQVRDLRAVPVHVLHMITDDHTDLAGTQPCACHSQWQDKGWLHQIWEHHPNCKEIGRCSRKNGQDR